MAFEGLSREEWEGLCEQCGLCCFEKLEYDDGKIVFTSTPCRYLDISTRRCRVYKKRFKVYPECVQLTPELVQELNWLHRSCGYKKALQDEQGQKRQDDRAERGAKGR